MSPRHSCWRGSLRSAILALLVAGALSLAPGSRAPASAQAPTPIPAGQQVVPLQVVDGPSDQTLALVPVCVLLAFPLAPVVDWVLRQLEWCGIKLLACPDCGSHDWSKGYTSGFGM